MPPIPRFAFPTGRAVAAEPNGLGASPSVDSNTSSQAIRLQRRESLKNDQKLDALWRTLEIHKRNRGEFDSGVTPNKSGYSCVRNIRPISVEVGHGLPVPIHAHSWCTAYSVKGWPDVDYCAGQAPEKNCENQLIYALDSGEGIFQFISPRSHRTGVSGHGPSIIKMLNELCDESRAKSPRVNLRLAKRYEITSFELLAGGHEEHDFAQYHLTARDIVTGEVRTVPLTQVGLRFDGQVLQNTEIRRANTLLEEHKVSSAELRGPQVIDTRPVKSRWHAVSRKGPMIVSHVGVGRNAALVIFNNIRDRIAEGGHVNKKNLDEVLYKLIWNGRYARGELFLHSKEQLRVVRQMLLDEIDARERLANANRPGWFASNSGAMRNSLSRMASQVTATVKSRVSFNSPRQPVAEAERQEPVQRALPNGVEVSIRNENTPSAHKIYTFTEERLNMDEFNKALHCPWRSVKSVSREGNNSWWRAGWMSMVVLESMMIRPANSIESKIVAAIGEQYRTDAQTITAMIESTRRSNIFSVITQGTSEPGKNEYSTECRLGASGGDAAGCDHVEQALQRLSAALLKKAGIDNAEIERTVYGVEEGNDNLLASLFEQIKTELLIFARGEEPQRNTFKILSHSKNDRDDLVFNDTPKEKFTEVIDKMVAYHAILLASGGHYDLVLRRTKLTVKA